MKSLKFTDNQVSNIISGKQTVTWRLFDDKQLDVGEEIELVNSQTGDLFGYATITEITIKHIKDLNDKDKDGHEVYKTKRQMLDKFRQFYGPAVDDDSIVKVVKYEYHKEKLSAKDVTNTTKITEVKLFCDGGSRGNPGPSATGFVIFDMEDNVVKKEGKYLGITTNNQAEYQAVLQGLTELKRMGVRDVHIYLDSLLVVNQMNGVFKIKNRELWPIHQAIKDMSQFFNKISFVHIPREMNKLADSQVNITLDKANKEGIASELL